MGVVSVNGVVVEERGGMDGDAGAGAGAGSLVLPLLYTCK